MVSFARRVPLKHLIKDECNGSKEECNGSKEECNGSKEECNGSKDKRKRPDMVLLTICGAKIPMRLQYCVLEQKT